MAFAPLLAMAPVPKRGLEKPSFCLFVHTKNPGNLAVRYRVFQEGIQEREGWQILLNDIEECQGFLTWLSDKNETSLALMWAGQDLNTWYLLFDYVRNCISQRHGRTVNGPNLL